MNLKTLIREPLWWAISNTYETENYSHAILDAMHYLSNVLREKSGLDGDGHSLVGAALGGSSPVLRVNKLQTETEKNIQRGLEQLLRGMYQFIRNPRGHEQTEDSKTTADAIILFINYVLSILEQSQEPFTTQSFLERVFDEHFVRSARYAELLVSGIPNGKMCSGQTGTATPDGSPITPAGGCKPSGYKVEALPGLESRPLGPSLL